jgi:membrane-associated protein
MSRPPATRIRNHGRTAFAGVAAVAGAAAALVALGAVDSPNPAATLSDASGSLGGWTYLAVPGLAFLETGAFVGLLVPGETAVVVGGVVAERGDVALPALIALVWLGAVGGDIVSFALGRRLGRRFLDAHGARLRIRPEHVDRVDRFFARHGGRAVLVGRFVGILRALTPFVAGASRLPLRRFLPYSVLGALAWAATFTLVGYAFASSFESAGETAARVALGGAVLVAVALVLGARLRRAWRLGGDEPRRGEGDQGAEPRPQEGSGEDVERVVHTQIHARESNRRRQPQRPVPQLRAYERDHGRGGERSGGVPRRERRVAGEGDDRSEVGFGNRRSGAVEELLEPVRSEGGAPDGHEGGRGGDRQTPPPQVRAEAQAHQNRPLDPPGRQDNEDRGQHRVLEERRGLDERPVEVERSHRCETLHRSKPGGLLILVNAHASGIDDPERTGDELVAVLHELGTSAGAAVTHSERELWEGMRAGAASGRRVALVGGDGSLHAAANAPLAALPELALIPAGRANNIGRALGIPSGRLDALQVAAFAPARPLDALHVRTPERSLYALEAVSAGFHAEARAAYAGENSADLLQGVRALAGALRRYRPYRVDARVDRARVGSSSAAQLFLSNIPYFGFGFEVDPGADPADGHLEAILIEAPGRLSLMRRLAAAYRGRHLARPGVRIVPGRAAALTEPLPLVADAIPLGTTTATVSVEPARLRVAAPSRPGGTA